MEQTTTFSPTETTANPPNRLLRWVLTVSFITLTLLAIFGDLLRTNVGLEFLTQRFQTFVTIFLGIFIEAAPFLLVGSLVSGLIAVFVEQSMLTRILPRQPILNAVAGAGLGLLFPVCECGVVPVTRRLYEKGLPMSVGIAFLLAAPVINPVVIISTYVAFGASALLWGRLAFSFLVALLVGLVFQFAKAKEVLLPTLNTSLHAHSHAHHDHNHNPDTTHINTNINTNVANLSTRLQSALTTAGDDFLDMARYLVLGSMLAAAMQTLVPQAALLSVGQGPLLSVLTMQALAFVLSICSTVDAFVALAFSGTFTTGSVLAFLVFGPMVDIKSSLMFLGVFQRRVVAYLILLPLLLTLLMGVAWNLYLG